MALSLQYNLACSPLNFSGKNFLSRELCTAAHKEKTAPRRTFEPAPLPGRRELFPLTLRGTAASGRSALSSMRNYAASILIASVSPPQLGIPGSCPLFKGYRILNYSQSECVWRAKTRQHGLVGQIYHTQSSIRQPFTEKHACMHKESTLHNQTIYTLSQCMLSSMCTYAQTCDRQRHLPSRGQLLRRASRGTSSRGSIVPNPCSDERAAV